jgi:hypothetical protein
MPHRFSHAVTFPLALPSSLRDAHRYWLILTTLGCASFLLACGAPGAPRPPRVEQPERITDLAVAQKGPAFELSFTRPLRAVDGERLTKSQEIEVFRAVTKPGEKPPEKLSSAILVTTASSAELDQHVEGDKIVFRVRLSDSEFTQSQGSLFSFAVRGLTHGYRNRVLEGDFSNIVRAELLDVSGPPENFQVKVTEKALLLGWTAPVRSLSGKDLPAFSVYRVLRSQRGNPESFELRGETTTAAFADTDFVFDQNYFYKVRAVFKQGDQVAESEDTAITEITPRDIFPPATPKNLSGLFNAGTVELVWKTNTEPDLAGYNVYRREKDSAPQKVNAELLRTPTFEDGSAQPGRHYFYRVTAVDFAHNESAASEEVEIETQ